MQHLLSNKRNIDGLVQDCIISIANTLEILQSYTKPTILQPQNGDEEFSQYNKKKKEISWPTYALTSIIVCITNNTDIWDSQTVTLTVKEIPIWNLSIALKI